jgi:hypothetical protein
MTLDYKILGQLYYGPEINETPEIPGTSGYYTTVTGQVAEGFVNIAFFESFAGYSTDGVTWTLTTFPFSGVWLSASYGNNVFVVVGVGNKALYSTDGINWLESTLPSTRAWTSVAYGSDKFVVVGNETNKALYSTDGVAWLESTLPSTQNWKSVTYGSGKFVAVTSDTDKVAYSTDGITWSESTLPLSQSWQSVTYGNGKFVAVSTASSPGTSIATYSTDGITWTQSSIPLGFWKSVTYGNGKFVAVGNSQASYSTDGISWTLGSISSATSLASVKYGIGKFVAVSSFSDTTAYSEDGISWMISTVPYSASSALTAGQISTLVEVQLSIGGQGTPGSYVEIVEPQVLYTVPAGTETTVTSIYVTNQDSVQRTYDLAVVPSGETLSLKHHIRWDMPVGSSDFDLTTAKLTLSAGDKIYVFPSTVNKVGFTAFGVEKS